MDDASFKVIIIGGSITGLTLAHCLDHAGIDYVVLEKHRDVHPQLGAAITFMPNGARILDQLGLFSDVVEASTPLDVTWHVFPDGFSFEFRGMAAVAERFGYGPAALERRKALEILYRNLSGKSRVHVRKKAVRITPDPLGVSVETEDGATYRGDIVVGADGIHSITRSEMWRIAEMEQPGFITQEEKSGICAEFNCVFGISNPIPDIKSWPQVIRYNRGSTILIFPNKEGRVFWTVISKLDKKYVYPNVPRYSQADAIAKCESILGMLIWQGVAFKSLWERRSVFTMQVLEESVLKTWSYRRIVCLGDSVSKMTPNIGQGATTAVESAASLSNGLHELIKASGAQTPSERQISEMLHNFSRKQRQRMETFYEISGFVARYHALDRLAHWVIARYVTPHTGDFIAASIGWGATEGTVLDYIPLPREDWPTLAWWQRLGVKRTMSLSRTVVIGIALLILHILTYQLICFVYPSF